MTPTRVGRHTDTSPRLALVVAGAAAALGSLDTAVNVAFPALSSDMGFEVSAAQWIVVSYVLTYTCLLVGAGRIVDLVGWRTMLLWGLAISSVSFVATAAAPNFGLLLAARIGQGVGVAIILVAAPAMVTMSVPAKGRGRALGLFQMSAAIGLALGPLVGGGLVAAFGWRAVFWFRFPLAIGLAVAVARWIPGAKTWPGYRQRLDLAPFRNGGFVLANVLNMLANASMFGIWLLVPYYTIEVLHTGAVMGGVVLMVVPAASAGAAPVAGWLSDRLGAGLLVPIGLGLQSIGLLALSTTRSDSSLVYVMAALAGVGAGLSLFGVPNMSYVMGSLSQRDQGLAAGTTQMARTAGIVLGVFITSAVFDRQRLGHARRLGVGIDSSASFVPAFQDTFTVASAVCLASAAVAVLIVRRH